MLPALLGCDPPTVARVTTGCDPTVATCVRVRSKVLEELMDNEDEVMPLPPRAAVCNGF